MDNAMSASTEHEIGIVDYPGAQVACILGLTDMFGVASTVTLDQWRFGLSQLRVTHWRPRHSRDANLSCVYDSAPHGSPKPRTLIIPPTLMDPDPDVPAGVVTWVRNLHAAGSTWYHCARACLSLPKRVLSMGGRLPHIRFAQSLWQNVFRESSSM
jgi:hypothetical protein